VAQLYSAVAEAFCDYIYRCCNGEEIELKFSKSFTDKGSCRRYWELVDEEDNYTYQLAVARGDLAANRSAMSACVVAWNATSCGSLTISALSKPTGPIECEFTNLFTGQKEAGESCKATSECRAGNRCSFNSSPAEGICLPYRELGDPCQATNDCLEELVCAVPHDSPQTCQSPSREGESCQDVICDPSDVDLYCGSETESPTGLSTKLCKRKLGMGEICTSSTQCRKDLWCDYVTTTAKTCAEKRADGLPCETSAQCRSAKCDTVKLTCTATATPVLSSCTGTTVGI
jgi:hypothetical protein